MDGIRELIAGGRVNTAELLPREVLGKPVKIRRHASAGELLDIAAAPTAMRPSMQVSMFTYDADGKPLFTSAEATRDLDWSIFEALLQLTREVKGLDLVAAEKK